MFLSMLLICKAESFFLVISYHLYFADPMSTGSDTSAIWRLPDQHTVINFTTFHFGCQGKSPYNCSNISYILYNNISPLTLCFILMNSRCLRLLMQRWRHTLQLPVRRSLPVQKRKLPPEHYRFLRKGRRLA